MMDFKGHVINFINFITSSLLAYDEINVMDGEHFTILEANVNISLVMATAMK